MNQAIQLVSQPKTSFTQDQKHDSKSDRFITLQPSHYANILAQYGYNLVRLNEGRARKEENKNHQTTVAVYQKETALTEVGDVFPRIYLKIPHLYGAATGFSGLYRLWCKNGAATKLNQTETFKVRHTGDAQSQFENLVAGLVAETDALSDLVKTMSAKDVTPTQVADFAREVASLRLGQGENIVKIEFSDLLKVRRQADTGSDAFTIYNIVQENVMRYGIRYLSQSMDNQGRPVLRNMTARPVASIRGQDRDSVRSIDLNVEIMEAAKKILLSA